MVRIALATIMAFMAVSVQAQVPDPNQIVQMGAQVAQLVDENRTGELWDSSSLVLKDTSPKGDFVTQIGERRNATGPARTRTWLSVSNARSNGDPPSVPQGEYVTVVFSTASMNNSIFRERISFRLDEDHVWRLAGYVVQ